MSRIISTLVILTSATITVEASVLDCDFEQPSICGYTQDETDHFDWIRSLGLGEGSTGPVFDHTLATRAGHFMVTEWQYVPLDAARLVSPTYQPSTGEECLQFWYHMSGDPNTLTKNYFGSLDVFFQVNGSRGHNKFSKSGAFGYEWLLGQIRILAGTSPFRVVFEAQVGENTNLFPRSYIAIDDIVVKTRSCTDLRGTMNDCGRILRQSEGEIFTPDTDGDGYYDNDVTCDWTIVTDPDKIVWLFIQKFELEKDQRCRFDNLKVYDGINASARLIGKYCGSKAQNLADSAIPHILRSTYSHMYIKFKSDGKVNGKGVYASFTAEKSDSWKRWPDGDYSIPMSIYGCPEQSINQWSHAYINLTLDDKNGDRKLQRPLNKNYRTWGDFILLGPYGRNFIQLNFCSKTSHVGKEKGVEWPRGTYGVYSNDGKTCPKGFTMTTGSLDGNFQITSHESGGSFGPKVDTDCSNMSCRLRLRTCMKAIADLQIDRSDLREPYLVVMPALGGDFEDKAMDTLLVENTSMKISLEKLFFTETGLELKYEYHILQIISVVPKGMDQLYRSILETIEPDKMSLFALGQPLEYRTVNEVTVLKLLPQTITLSRRKWNFLNHGAFHCLAHPVIHEHWIDVYCLNDPEYLSVRYMTLMENRTDARFLRELTVKNWFASILSDRAPKHCDQSLGMADGYIEDFQINASSETPHKPGSKGRLGDIGWCSRIKWENNIDTLQIDLLRPTIIEGVLIQSDPDSSYGNDVRVSITVLNDSWIGQIIINGHQWHGINLKPETEVMFSTPVTGRYIMLGFTIPEDSHVCIKSEIIGCRNTNLKHLQDDSKNRCEMKRTRHIFRDFLFDGHMLGLGSNIANESLCSNACLGFPMCLNEVVGDERVLYGVSPTRSYGAKENLPQNEFTCVKICQAANTYSPSLYPRLHSSCYNITTKVEQPGIITSHDFPFHYSSGELWIWQIVYNDSVTVNLIMYNVSFNQFQVIPLSYDGQIRYSDNIDRLYITTAAFSCNEIFTDDVVNATGSVLRVFDRTTKNYVPEYMTGLHRVKLFWRTVVQFQTAKRDSTAVGFRLLAYPTYTTYCQSSVQSCSWNNAVVLSPFVTADLLSTEERWVITVSQQHYIRFQFETFDVGCQSGSVLEVELSTTNRRVLCNSQNKPAFGLNSSDNHLQIKFFLYKKPGELINTFTGHYTASSFRHVSQGKQETVTQVNLDITESEVVRAVKVCSEHFRKCFILTMERKGTTWLFVDELCRRNNFSLVSLHSREEEEFVGDILFGSLNMSSSTHIYIGLQKSASKRWVYKWTDASPVTYTSWAHGHPLPEQVHHCTRISVHISEAHTWESLPCSKPTLTVPACQHYRTPSSDTRAVYYTEKTNNTRDMTRYPLAVFVCDNGEIISLLGRCDNKQDCDDGTDERNCPDTTEFCAFDQFSCGDGQCVSTSVLCDHQPDCANNQDEDCVFPACNQSTEYRCKHDQKCIPLNARCDGKLDCFDHTDELHCTSRDCSKQHALPCDDTCIPVVFGCDGTVDCVTGQDETDCHMPDSCTAWWAAGYQESGMYSIRGVQAECDFSEIVLKHRIITRFYNIDYERSISTAAVSSFSYIVHKDTLRDILSGTCYQSVDQLCQNWIKPLYDIDQTYERQRNTSSSIHACKCLRYTRRLVSNTMLQNDSVVEDCEETSVQDERYFHLEFSHDQQSGLIDSMRLKEGHSFDINRLKLRINPIVCYAEETTVDKVGDKTNDGEAGDADMINEYTEIECGFGFSAAKATMCLYKQDIYGHIVGCRSFNHLQHCELFSCPADYFKCPRSFCIERHYACDGIPHCQFGEDEDSCHLRSCMTGFRCLQSRICLPTYYLCDGFSQCPLGDDERICNISCPDTCICRGYFVTCKVKNIKKNITIPLNTRQLDLSGNYETLYYNIFGIQLEYLVHLNISSCGISSVTNATFSKMMNLIVLDMSWNSLESLPSHLFESQRKLKTLKMSNNQGLLHIRPYAFGGLNLDSLDLSLNRIEKVSDEAFAALQSETIYLNESEIHIFSTDMFNGIEYVGLLVTNAFKFCCIKPYFLAEESCFPHATAISSCDNLLQNEVIRPFAWTVGLTAIVSNILAFIYRMYDKERLKLGYGIFVSNLAISDFLMGVYLVIIASADVYYRGDYMMHDDAWRTGWLCNFAGVIATLSSETSILCICLVSLDRLLVVKFPFGEVRLKEKASWILVSIIWVLGLFISIFPIVFTSYFKGEFYSRSSVCLALPLTSDRPAGWLYSVLIFVGLNCLVVVIIVLGQWLIFREVITTAADTQPKCKKYRKRELTIARNLLLVAMTDFLCWFPVGVLGLLALSGVTISGDVYSWITVFVLPINSALNPFLYTLFAAFKKESMVPQADENIQMLTFPKEKVESFFKIWQHDGFFMNATPTGYKPLVTVLEASTQGLRWRVETGKAILKCLKFLHERDTAQENFSISDVFIKPLSFARGSVQLKIDARTKLAYTSTAKAGNIKSFGEIFSQILQTHAKDEEE